MTNPNLAILKNRFAEIAEAQQRDEIKKYMETYVVQLGLFGEAINEHKLSPQIAAAFYDGDKKLLGELIYAAIFEYVGNIVRIDTP